MQRIKQSKEVLCYESMLMLYRYMHTGTSYHFSIHLSVTRQFVGLRQLGTHEVLGRLSLV